MGYALAILIALVVGFIFAWVAKRKGWNPVKAFVVGATAVAAIFAVKEEVNKRKRGR